MTRVNCRALLTALCAVVLPLVCAPRTAISRTYAARPAARRTTYQGVLIIPKTSVTPGQALDCEVQLNGGPEVASIYSSPAGAVSWSGSISNGNKVTVHATTASSISTPTVTVYLVTDGATTVSASVNVDSASHDGPGGN